MLSEEIIHNSNNWVEHVGPQMHVVISSRSRLARNIEGYGYCSSARKEELQTVAEMVNTALGRLSNGRRYIKIPLQELDEAERNYLVESRLISPEMQKCIEHRYVYLSSDTRVSIMINEEDHIRMQSLSPGFQIQETFDIINRIDDDLSEILTFAYSGKFGYLTACPTNTGTGLRVSVMLHLPGLAVQDKIKELVEIVQPHGIAIRGFYGEHSGFDGDFYQISNEITLGKSEQDIIDTLNQVIGKIIEREDEARYKLFAEHPAIVDDIICRSYGLLRYARRIDTGEALQLLSRLRLGIDQDYFQDLTHQMLNKLIVEIHPGHLQILYGHNAISTERDKIRANHLRRRFQSIVLSK